VPGARRAVHSSSHPHGDDGAITPELLEERRLCTAGAH
jgi:hypothetical protein